MHDEGRDEDNFRVPEQPKEKGKGAAGGRRVVAGREYTTEVIRTSEIVCGRVWLYIQRYSKNGQELGKTVIFIYFLIFQNQLAVLKTKLFTFRHFAYSRRRRPRKVNCLQR